MHAFDLHLDRCSCTLPEYFWLHGLINKWNLQISKFCLFKKILTFIEVILYITFENWIAQSLGRQLLFQFQSLGRELLSQAQSLGRELLFKRVFSYKQRNLTLNFSLGLLPISNTFLCYVCDPFWQKWIFQMRNYKWSFHSCGQNPRSLWTSYEKKYRFVSIFVAYKQPLNVSIF